MLFCLLLKDSLIEILNIQKSNSSLFIFKSIYQNVYRSQFMWISNEFLFFFTFSISLSYMHLYLQLHQRSLVYILWITALLKDFLPIRHYQFCKFFRKSHPFIESIITYQNEMLLLFQHQKQKKKKQIPLKMFSSQLRLRNGFKLNRILFAKSMHLKV